MHQFNRLHCLKSQKQPPKCSKKIAYSQENTRVTLALVAKTCSFIKKRDFSAGVFPWICKSFAKTFFTEHLWATAEINYVDIPCLQTILQNALTNKYESEMRATLMYLTQDCSLVFLW